MKINFRVIDGIVMQPNWPETFRRMEVGESKVIKRRELTTFRARQIVCEIKKRTGMCFSVAMGELDEYCTVTRTQ